jgi:hypothetical protein
MLPHSKPHVPTVKQHKFCIRKILLAGFQSTAGMLSNTKVCGGYDHPFIIDGKDNCHSKTYVLERQNLRAELAQQLLGDDIEKPCFVLSSDVMFESCSIQPTGALSFHQDVLNCPSMDSTFALHLPFHSSSKCLSLLYYSRKCVGDFAVRMSNIQEVHEDISVCSLSAMHEDNDGCMSLFDCQIPFENEQEIN